VGIEEAAALLKNGEVVAFPTETVYGLGADATSAVAVSKIFAAKGRPSDNPLIVHIGALEQLRVVVSEIPDVARALMDAFWPGPLTLILPKQENMPREVTAGLSTVGVRMPSHPLALALLREAGLPIAAPSANVSGRPSPTAEQHVLDDLEGKIAGILAEGGVAEIGLESTVLDCTTKPPTILRPGAVTKAELEGIIGAVDTLEVQEDSGSLAPKSPGMKYKHYAPSAPMTIVRGSEIFFQQVIWEAQSQGKRVGILVAEENRDRYEADVVLTCGTKRDLSTIARRLYDALRELDEHAIDVIYCEGFPETGLGEAIWNRLLKASEHRVLEEG